MTKKSVRQLAQDIAEQQERTMQAQAAAEAELARQQRIRGSRGGTQKKGSNGKGPQ